MSDMTTPKPEQDRHDAEAARLLAPHLTGRLAPTLDPQRVAALLVSVMREHGWRYIPRPAQIPDPGRRDPDGYRRNAAKAREELTKALAETKGDNTDG